MKTEKAKINLTQLAKIKMNFQKTVRYCCLQWRNGIYIDRNNSGEYITQ